MDEIRNIRGTENRKPIEPSSVKMKATHEDSEISELPPKQSNKFGKNPEEIK